MLNSHANIQHAPTSFPAPRSDYTNQSPLMAIPMQIQKAEEDAITVRPPASAQLLVDSLDRYPFQFGALQQLGGVAASTPGNNFLLQSQNALIYGYFTRLAITQVYLKYTLPTVVDASDVEGAVGNNIFSVTQTGQPAQQIKIPTGFYTPQSLAAAITTAFAGSTAPYTSYTCTWNQTAGAFQFASNNGQTFVFGLTVFGATAATNPIARCKYLLGVTPDITTGPQGTPRTVQVCGPPHLYYTSFVDIISQRLTKYQKVRDSESGTGATPVKSQTIFPALQNIVARVYLVPPNTRIALDASGSPTPGSAPADIVVDYNTPKHIRWSPNEAVYELDFQLRDQFGQLLPWSPRYPTEFLLTMLASET